MHLTDATPLLNQVSAERFERLLAACRTKRSKHSDTRRPMKLGDLESPDHGNSLSYVEPSLSRQTAQGVSNMPKTQGALKQQGAGAGQDTIKSKIYALGDFVDTDAVSDNEICYVVYQPKASDHQAIDHPRRLYLAEPNG